MENNEKRPKRPRIRTNVQAPNESTREFDSSHYEKVNFAPRPYQPRFTQERVNENGYQPRPNGYYNNDNPHRSAGGYNNDNPHRNTGGYSRPYNPEYRNTGYSRSEGSNYRNDRGEQGYRQPNRQYTPRPNNRNDYHNDYQGNGRPYAPRPNNNPGRRFPATGNGPQRRPMQRRQYDNVHGGPTFVPRPQPVQYEMPLPDPNAQVRLNKFMANSGICSRREADEFIKQGLVKVNGKVVTELGTKITHSDSVEFDQKIVALENKAYILLNKPKDCVTTSDDPNGRLTVLDLVKGACNERIYPVGRLDRNTTGVLLLTNDGDLASKLTHPKYVKKKIYHVWVDRDIAPEDMQRIADGIELEDGMIHADAISYATPTDRNQAGIEIHSGQNRIVRRIFEKLGYHVTKLDRVYFAGLTKKNLPRGRWRYLTQQEVNMLKRGAFE